MFRVTKSIFLSTIVLLFSACGGGDGGSVVSNDTGSEVKNYSGVLIDSVVEGARYVCGNNPSSHYTDKNGKFECSALPISFYVGNIKLGQITTISSDNEVHIQDIVGVSRSNINNAEVVKIGLLLQSLDANNNPKDGITISQERDALLDDIDLNLTALTIEELKIKLLEQDSSIVFISTEEVMAHLASTNGTIVDGIQTDVNTTQPENNTSVIVDPIVENNTTQPEDINTSVVVDPVVENNATQPNTNTPVVVDPVVENNATQPDNNTTQPNTNTPVVVDPVVENNTTVEALPVSDTAITTVYEDAEDGNIDRWRVYGDGGIASISNVNDVDAGSNVILLGGLVKENTYTLGEATGVGAWNNGIDKTLEWKMQVDSDYDIYVALETTNGIKYIQYEPNNDNKVSTNSLLYVRVGLGVTSMDGAWHTFTRNLEDDLHTVTTESDTRILSVNAFRVKGHGKIDDVVMKGNIQTVPEVTLIGASTVTLLKDGVYIEEGVTAVDAREGTLSVDITGEVDTSTIGQYIVTYSATNEAGTTTSITREVNVVTTVADKKIKLYTYDVNNNLFKIVVTGEYLDLREAMITLTGGSSTYTAKFPTEVQLGHLRRGTIITISTGTTDTTYAPFSINGGDWEMTMAEASLTNKSGTFTLSNQPTVSIVSKDGAFIWLPATKNQEAVDFATLRANRDLIETGGIALSNIPGLSGLIKDAESLLYVPVDNSLWIVDDNSYRVYEMDFTTHEIKTIITRNQLLAMSGLSGVGADQTLNDMESIIYDDQNDILYILVGSAASHPAIFRLTRGSDNKFRLGDDDSTTLDYRLLDYEHQAAQYIDNEFIIADEYQLFSYNFETDTKSELLFEMLGNDGKVYGMAYNENEGALWIVTSQNNLIKLDWATKTVLARYAMADNTSAYTYNGVYDTRGLEIIDNQLYILEGMNNIATTTIATAPYGSALKSSIHIYEIPVNNVN